LWFGLAGAALVVGVGAQWIYVEQAAQARVEPGEINERVLARAVVESADGVAKLRARTDGRVKRVLVRFGDQVHAGDLLAEIEESELATEVSRRDAERRAAELAAQAITEGARPEERAITEAEVEATRRELALAEDRAGRQARLKQTGSTSEAAESESQRALEIARAKLASLEAQLALAKAGGRGAEIRAAQARAAAAGAALQIAKTDLSRTRIVSPIDGVVLERRIDPGDTITGTATGGPPLPLFEIADTNRLEARLEVEDRDAAKLALGQLVIVTPEGGGGVLARSSITRLGPQLSNRTLSLGGARVRADARIRAAWAPLEGASVVIGQQLEAKIVLSHRQVDARVPRAAVAIRDGQPVVKVLWGPLTREVPVQLGAADDAGVEVRGLQVGQMVLLH
jgi:multidrug efflux pump subunit AcrA (membrane-fusion protein)